MTLSVQINAFLKYLRNETQASPKTIQNYNHYLKRFLDFAGDIESSKIDEELIKKYHLHLAHWIDPQTNLGLKKITQNYFMIALRVFLRYLAQQGVAVIKAEQVKLNQAETSPLKVLESNDLEKLLQAPDITDKSGLRDKALLEVLFSTGARVSETSALNRDDVNLLVGEVVVRRKGKTKDRQLSLSESAVKWLNTYLQVRKDTFAPLFIRFQGTVDLTNQGERMRLTPRSIQRIVEKYVKSTGLSVKATPQTLRHSMATDLITQGKDLKSVQRILGHNNLSTTQVYTHVPNRYPEDVH